MPVTTLLTRDGELDQSELPKFADLRQRLEATRPKTMLHLHGGLVNEQSGMSIAQRLAANQAESYAMPPDWEQIYVIWRTGPLETLQTNWNDLFKNDRLYGVLLKRLLGFVGRKLGVPDATGRSGLAAVSLDRDAIAARLAAEPKGDPFADVDAALELDIPSGRGPKVAAESDSDLENEFAMELELDGDLAEVGDDIAAHLTFDAEQGRSLAPKGDPDVGAAAFARLDASVRREIDVSVPKSREGRALFTGAKVIEFLVRHAARIAIRIIRRFRGKRDHGFYPTVAEEFVREMYGDLLGASIWGMMKTDASDHFRAGAFGAQLLDALESAKPERFALCAHSAGAIWACEMIKQMGARPAFTETRVALMAPAVRTKLFAEAIAKGGARIKDMRIFTMRDELEASDPVLGEDNAFIYPRSLLYLVSGLFEEKRSKAYPDAPILGMQRFLRGDHAEWLSDPDEIAGLTDALAYLAAAPRRLVYATTNGGPGLSSSATSHGAFDRDPDTLRSVREFITQ